MSGYFPEDHDYHTPDAISVMGCSIYGWVGLPTLTSWALTGLVATTLRAGVEEWNVRPWVSVLESVFLSI
jgi:hypothetical protein